jgi:hypothetical protein
VGENMKQQELSFIAERMKNSAATMKGTLAVS